MTFVVGEFMALLFYFIFIRGFPRNMRKMDFLFFFFGYEQACFYRTLSRASQEE